MNTLRNLFRILCMKSKRYKPIIITKVFNASSFKVNILLYSGSSLCYNRIVYILTNNCFEFCGRYFDVMLGLDLKANKKFFDITRVCAAPNIPNHCSRQLLQDQHIQL